MRPPYVPLGKEQSDTYKDVGKSIDASASQEDAFEDEERKLWANPQDFRHWMPYLQFGDWDTDHKGGSWARDSVAARGHCQRPFHFAELGDRPGSASVTYLPPLGLRAGR
jgi:hypothetical protein